MGLMGILYREFEIKFKSFMMIVIIFLTPLLYMLIFGIMMQSVVGQITYHGVIVDYTTFLTPGIFVLVMLYTSVSSCTTIYTDKQLGMFEVLLASPVSVVEYIIAKIISALVVSLLQIGVIILIAAALFQFLPCNLNLIGFLSLILGIFLGTLCISSIAFILAASSTTADKFNALFNMLYLPLMFASTIFYPSNSNTPLILKIITMINPLTHLSNLLRLSFIGIVNWELVETALISLVYTLLLFIIAVVIFKRKGIPE